MSKPAYVDASALAAALNDDLVQVEGNDYAKGFNAGLRHALMKVGAMRRAKMRDLDKKRIKRQWPTP